MYSEFALAVEAEVIERWRFLKKDKWQCLVISYMFPSLHSMHVNTVASMNVAIVSTWAYVHKDGREIFSVYFIFFVFSFQTDFAR